MGLILRRRASESPANIRNSVAEHIAIGEAIQDRDQDRAEAAQDTHINSILRTTLEVRDMDFRAPDNSPDIAPVSANSPVVDNPEPLIVITGDM